MSKAVDVTETRLPQLAWDPAETVPADGLGGDRHKGGVISIRALMWNVGTCTPMPRERLKRPTRESQSTEAGCRGGGACSSDEGPVMGLERSGRAVQTRLSVNHEVCGMS